MFLTDGPADVELLLDKTHAPGCRPRRRRATSGLRSLLTARYPENRDYAQVNLLARNCRPPVSGTTECEFRQCDGTTWPPVIATTCGSVSSVLSRVNIAVPADGPFGS